MPDVLTDAQLNELVLEDGKVGYDRRGNQMKIGDGKTAWPDLRPIAGRFNDFPMNNGVTYAVRNGKWVPIYADAKFTAAITSPAVEEVNKQGEYAVSILFPYKPLVNGRKSNAIMQIARRQLIFPFAEGRLKQIKARTRMGSVIKFNVTIAGTTNVLLTDKAINTDWQSFDCDAYVRKDEVIEIFLSQSLDATDIQFELRFKVGNATYEHIGEADMNPNVYVTGTRAEMWGINGPGLSPNGAFRKPYIPAVHKLRQIDADGWAAQDVDGHWHVCEGHFNLPGIYSNTPTTPTPYEVEALTDIHATCNNYTGYIRESDGKYYHCLSKSSGYDKLSDVRAVMINKIVYDQSSSNNLTRAVLLENGTIVHWSSATGSTPVTITALPPGKTVKQMVGMMVLMTDGTLYRINGTSLTQVAGNEAISGHITKIFGPCDNSASTSQVTFRVWAQTDDDALYFMGNGANGASGIYNMTGTSSFKKYKDDFPVKDVQSHSGHTVLLTESGQLYASGTITGNIFGADFKYAGSTLQSFTPIYPEYKFSDFVITAYGFVGIGEYIGEIDYTGGEEGN